MSFLGDFVNPLSAGDGIHRRYNTSIDKIIQNSLVVLERGQNLPYKMVHQTYIKLHLS